MITQIGLPNIPEGIGKKLRDGVRQKILK